MIQNIIKTYGSIIENYEIKRFRQVEKSYQLIVEL